MSPLLGPHADNAMPLSQRSCSITPMSVSPKEEEPRLNEDRIERRVRVVEGKNEVVEIPSRGRDKREWRGGSQGGIWQKPYHLPPPEPALA